MEKERHSTVCEHCGASLASRQGSCPQCGHGSSVERETPRVAAKVISLSERRRVLRRPRPRQRPLVRGVLWWLVGILAAALILPYLLPLHP